MEENNMTTDRILIKAPILSIIDACIRAMRDCNIELISKKDSFIIGKTIPTPFSWGEEICIKIQQLGDEVEIEANSEYITQFIDFRKGEKFFLKKLKLRKYRLHTKN